MFKGKIKTESEVFSEQRYRDAAVVIYHQLKKTNQLVSNDQNPIKAPIQGWTNEDTDAAPCTQYKSDTPENSQDIVARAPGHVQSKACTLV